LNYEIVNNPPASYAPPRRNPERVPNRFGTDLPSTRAPRSYLDSDYTLVLETLGEEKAANVFHENAIGFYRPKKIG
jgi:hypothetical protein